MNAFRSLLVFTWLVVSLIPMGLGLLICSIFVGDRLLWRWFGVPWLSGVIGAARIVGGVKYRVHGQENLPTPDDMQRIILCPKHQSTWETFFFPAWMPRMLAYVFKQELLRIPVFGWAMGRLNMIHIDRSKRSEAWTKVARQGEVLMDQGKWIIMFPEGTRSERGSQGKYKTGATRLATLTGASIIPIAVTSAKCWPRGTFWFIPGTIDVSIGAPIPSEGRDQDEMMVEIEEWIESEMRRLDPEAYQ
ncbi:1-acyl-sn-glycerol-3-phosphate acyltransferase [Halioglobus japonicus]|uniref:1-acyl-sn-glycerol-3-phosphate acyltransferase n=1 Tax=Halioglobus japonicus TaxID=930805 RepID=A0AAP8MFA9_9GAMM|nr:lysophospholipid acyltransferase family protein [Halioglobus japonicus]AQA18677.1 1-acyl-sn-glycerol-3-phosphate acyltransferase [Halioglobus japonicus]PLW86705.1 1-acyl-sn-glycerol-3-phosphate acyltransferase [Halioglobus japonicus]GHD11495.1 1-acyl-sn-glycerol-3-phosphate acyltransferase [Halioglobus japonicus]